ncbi:MAG: (2Fe-2S) ferredoxin domain-containing protein [Candidatus Methylophosphatis roskildensis]
MPNKPIRHVFVCSQARPPGHPRGSCAQKGCNELLQVFWKELQQRNAYDTIAITYAGCLGPCDLGANVLVYPEGILYNKVSKEDVFEIFDRHLVGGEPVERLLAANAVWS